MITVGSTKQFRFESTAETGQGQRQDLVEQFLTAMELQAAGPEAAKLRDPYRDSRESGLHTTKRC